MLLSPEEFIAIKSQFVEEVLHKLRTMARLEAELLCRMLRRQPRLHLPQASIRLSHAVIRTADAIQESLHRLEPSQLDTLSAVMDAHLPDILLQTAGDRLRTHMPEAYRQWVIAKSLAAHIVYREGIEAVEAVEQDSVASLAVAYLQREADRAALADEVDASSLEHAQEIADLLRTTSIMSSMPMPEHDDS